MKRPASFHRRVTDIELSQRSRHILRRRADVEAAALNAGGRAGPVEYRVVRRGGTWAVVAYQAVLEQRASA